MRHVSFSFFRYRTTHVPSAFVLMGFQGLFKGEEAASGNLKLMGCGGDGGFSLLPDLKTYCLVCLLDDPTRMDAIRDTRLYRWVSRPAVEQLHFQLTPLSGHGTWDGREVFDYAGNQDPERPFVVLTRARVKASRVLDFWRAVPRVRTDLRDHPGCGYAQGIGEYPLLSLATFSVWGSLDQMRTFAYRDSPHHETVRSARRDQWLSESLFTRLALERIDGDVERYPKLERLLQERGRRLRFAEPALDDDIMQSGLAEQASIGERPSDALARSA
ncbi:spheroidene monooxygenase [Thiorhodococcus drewsii AZ1]|uniref:Spheroidene monooxygenase n=1 Tax=Thiorhodococcus drewsii AZ1 TaxID=765913 RepID=G2E871_9GAMM|nr:hypothetical protein [Thiorhodococcus drewsii]EGV27707.1 spheroidene monooxygenase [Thiorhodococcus drewsii AZ1]